jgi:hypothetical protein
MAGHCQECDGCCRVFEVKEVSKAFGEPCKHLGPAAIGGHGCTIYGSRPEACRHYVCLWLDSQRKDPVAKMTEELRPDVCKVVMGWPWGIDRETLFVYPYPGHETAWQRPPVSDHLRMILSLGGKIVVVTGQNRIALKGDMAIIGTEEEFAELLM